MQKKSADSGSSKVGASETTPLVARSDLNEGNGGGGGDGDVKVMGGLTISQVTLLIAGEMAGSGVLALPRALTRTGWFGVPLMIVLCGIALFSGQRLGDCWTMLEARNPEMRTRKRNPYAIIAGRALGTPWSVAVSIAIMVTLFGASVVYLLMAAQIVEEVLLSMLPTVTYCSWYLIVTLAATPLIMFGTPKDFSFTGVIALLSTVVACILYFIQMMVDVKPFPIFRYGIHGFQDFFMAFGTIMFAFGGASTFPTIQNDMVDKEKFGKSILYSFTGILLLYLPLAIAGYVVYGESVSPNFATSLSPTPLTLAANILMAVHLISAFLIIINPVCQEVEEIYDVPRDSMKYRIAVRLSLMAAILFIGETIPKFHTLLALVGSSTVALLTFVLPSCCYLKLTEEATPAGETARPRWIRLVCWEVILVGVVGGVCAFFSSLAAVLSTSPAKPCYLK